MRLKGISFNAEEQEDGSFCFLSWGKGVRQINNKEIVYGYMLFGLWVNFHFGTSEKEGKEWTDSHRKENYLLGVTGSVRRKESKKWEL